MREEISPEELNQLRRTEAIECRKKWPNLVQETIDQIVPRPVRQTISQRVPLLTFEEFCEQSRGDATAAASTTGAS